MTEHVKVYGVKPRIQYVADGILTIYEFPFAIFKTSDINVYFGDELQDSSSYTVSEARHSDGGSVTFESAPASGTIITIVRNLSVERTSDFQEGSTLRAKVLNDELDYQIACQQQIADNLNRSMVLPPYATDSDVNLTLPTPSAGKAIVWNSEGTNLENSNIEVNALESTIRGYKEAAESASATAVAKADIATTQAGIATAKSEEATTTLSSKANKDMDNVSETGKTHITSFSFPSENYINLTLDTTGSSYIMPANGWLNIIKQSSTTGKYVALYNLSKGEMGVTSSAVTTNARCICLLPVEKDDEVICNYDANGATVRFRFYYAEGEI